jgi:hypothetical protein
MVVVRWGRLSITTHSLFCRYNSPARVAAVFPSVGVALNVCSVPSMSAFSSPLQAVVDLFSGPLQGVRFADIDGEGLGNLASEVEALGSEVEAHEAQLTSLREVLVQKQELLLALAQQALAYARIYAESDEALSAELNDIALPRATKPRKSASVKQPSERGVKVSKDEADSGEQTSVAPAESATLTKSKRKAVASEAALQEQSTEALPYEEVAAPAKGGRRKLPARSGRGR